MEKSISQKIQDWHDLMKKSVITEVEFTNKKQELLGVAGLSSGNKNSLTVASETSQSNTTEPPVSIDEQIKKDEEYNNLFNRKSWFQKNKKWVACIFFIISIGSTIWHFTNNQNATKENVLSPLADKEKILINFIQLEQKRNYAEIKNYYSEAVERYWDLSHPSNLQIEKRYQHFWDITINSENKVINVEKVDEDTYDVISNFQYAGKKTQRTTLIQNTRTRFIFDGYGKIKSTYGVDQ